MTDRPDVSVIIVNHYADRILDDCVAAVAAESPALRRELIVIDNPPIDNPRPLGRFSDTVPRRIPAGARLGFGAACNLGVRHATGEYLLFLNPDVAVEPGAVDRLYEVCATKPNIGAAIGRLTLPDGKFYPSCRQFPTLTNLLFSHGSILHRLSGSAPGMYMLPDYDRISEVDWGAAALMMIRRKTFDDVSGFDERFFMYLEDTDLCRRLRQAGFRNYYVPEAGGVHFWGYSTRRYPFQRIVWHHRSIWRYFVKHGNSLPILAALAPILAGNCLLSLFFKLFTLRK